MRDPPDIWRGKPSPTSKFLVITRISYEETQSEVPRTLAGVSPFTIKTIIDLTCGGEVVSCKKTRDGNLLVQTKDQQQADKLLKLTNIPNNIPVAVSEHRTLNYTKGVIYSNDLRGIKEEEILENLRSQKVSEVKKIMKRAICGDPTETGLITLTFAKLDLPDYVYIGYERVEVRPYIPSPMRCNNCLRLGHLMFSCKSSENCYRCSQTNHVDLAKGQKCERAVSCINCTDKSLPNSDHHPRDRNCPVFLTHREVQAIKTKQKVDYRTAWNILKSRHHHDGSLYASVANSSNQKNSRPQHLSQNTPSTSASTSHNPPPTANTGRQIISYDDNDDENMSTDTGKEQINNGKTPQITILSRNISNKTKRHLISKEKFNPTMLTRSMIKNTPSSNVTNN